MDSSGTIGADAVRTRFAVRNLTWELAAAPENGWLPVWRTVLSILIIVTLSVFVGFFTDVVLHLRESNRKLTILSYTDKLTELLNRRSYEEAKERLRHQALPEDFVIMTALVHNSPYHKTKLIFCFLLFGLSGYKYVTFPSSSKSFTAERTPSVSFLYPNLAESSFIDRSP